jgi:hypothetical protein
MTARSRSGVVLAWLGLLAADAVMRLGGFHALYAAVRKFPLRREGSSGAEQVQSVLCAAMQRAASLYFRRARCLQRSAATTCLLRWYGVPAEMVIAVQKFPFRAHAWVECNGIVVNDRSEVQQRFVVLERC